MTETPPFLDVCALSLNHHGEELCGDQVRILRTADRTIVVLSDGLGSGVKANILARLTAEIIVTMIREAASLEDVMETVLGTLPVCKVRKIAYATFLVVEIQHRSGAFRVVNFDSPEPFFLPKGRPTPLSTRRQTVQGKDLLFSEGALAEGDFLGLASDGVLFAGMGGLLSFGWGREQIAAHLQTTLRLRAWTAQAAVSAVIEKTGGFYGPQVGDDATFVGILARSANRLMVFTGPPLEKDADERCARRLLAFGGRRAICGGTTARIVGDHTGEVVGTDIATVREDVPPIGSLSDVDLVTEGILTLAGTLKLLHECGGNPRHLPEDRNGAVLLARELLRADSIFFLAGSRVNPYYQNPLLPKSVSIRRSVLDQIVEALRGFHKEVAVEWC